MSAAYPDFKLDQARGAMPRYDGSLQLVDEPVLLSLVPRHDIGQGLSCHSRVERSVARLQITAAQIVGSLEGANALTMGDDLDIELCKLLGEGSYYVEVPEANHLVVGSTAVAELNAIAATNEPGHAGLVVSGLGEIGLLATSESRQLYVARPDPFVNRPPDSEYVPYIR